MDVQVRLSTGRMEQAAKQPENFRADHPKRHTPASQSACQELSFHPAVRVPGPAWKNVLHFAYKSGKLHLKADATTPRPFADVRRQRTGSSLCACQPYCFSEWICLSIS